MTQDEVLIRFRLVGDEARALIAWSTRELRSPRDQLRWLLRNELEQRGLITPTLQCSEDRKQTGKGTSNEG